MLCRGGSAFAHSPLRDFVARRIAPGNARGAHATRAVAALPAKRCARRLTANPSQQVFNANCAACHAGGQNSVVADHTLEKAAIEKFLTGGFKESSVVTQVRCAPSADPVPIELRRSPATTLSRIFVDRKDLKRAVVQVLATVPAAAGPRRLTRALSRPGDQRQERHAGVRRPPLGGRHRQRRDLRDHHLGGGLGVSRLRT